MSPSRKKASGAPPGVLSAGRLRAAAPAAWLALALSGCRTGSELLWPASAGPAPVGPSAAAGKGLAAPRPPGPPVTAAAPPSLRSGTTAANVKVAAPSGVKVDRGVAQAATSTDPKIPLVDAPPSVPPAPAEYPIDLSTALRLAEAENPDIAAARQEVFSALALLQGARALLLPTLNAGLTYHGHVGNLQRSSGRILNLSEQSLYIGGGARTLAAETVNVPMVNIVSPLTDALYSPIVESQRVDAARLGSVAAANSILLDVASLHFDLVAAEIAVGFRRESEAEAAQLAKLTLGYAEAGQGRRADAERSANETLLFHRDVQRAEEEFAVASVRLSRRLHLDPVVRLRSVAPVIVPITLVDIDVPTEELVRAAVGRRPEIGASAAAIGVAETRFRQERARPFLPTLWLGFSGGAFGGGSNLVPPDLGNFRGRTDFDVRLYWTAQNLGFGNLALMKSRQAEIGQAVGAQSLAINQVRREVTEAQSLARAYRLRIGNTQRELETAQAGFREELDRIRNTVGRPVEATTSLRLLADARLHHLNAVVEYDRAQFQLFVALGSPPPLLSGADCGPLPPAPVAPPPTPPPSASHSPSREGRQVVALRDGS